jgi:hypothetical protein
MAMGGGPRTREATAATRDGVPNAEAGNKAERESAPRRIRVGNMVLQRSGPTNVPGSNKMFSHSVTIDRQPVAG